MSWSSPKPMSKQDLLNMYMDMDNSMGSYGLEQGSHASPLSPLLSPDVPLMSSAAQPPPADTTAAKTKPTTPVDPAAGAASVPPAASPDDAIRGMETARYDQASSQIAQQQALSDQAGLAAYDAGTQAGMAQLDTADAERSTEAAKASALADVNTAQSEDLKKQKGEFAVMLAEANTAKKKADILASQAAQAEMKDFWADKSTGPRLMGIIAQTLSGAANGLAGQPGAPSAVDRIIDRDFEVQKRNLSHKVESSQAAQGALAQIYNSYQSKDQAWANMRQAAYEKVKSEIQEMDANFKSATSSSRSKTAIAQAEQKSAQFSQQVADTHVTELQRVRGQAADNLVQMRGQDATKDAIDAAQDKNMLYVPGFIEPWPKTLATQFLMKNQDLGAAVSQVNGLEAVLNKGGDSLETYRRSEVGNVFLRAVNRGILGTGANLSPEENADLNKTMVSFLKGRAVETLGVQERHEFFSTVRNAIGRIYRGRAQAVKKNATPDLRDKLWGPTMQELQAERQGVTSLDAPGVPTQ